MKPYLFCSIILSLVFGTGLFAGTRYYRLSYRDDPATSVVVGWCDNGTSANATVYYGTTDYGTNYLNYPLSHVPDRTVDYDSLTHRFARLTLLLPNTVYYFVVHDDQGTSSRMCFKTLPDNADSPVTFIAGGDSRTAKKGEFADSAKCRIWRQDANRLVSKISPDFITFSGDYVLTSLLAYFWNDWFADWQLTITPEGRLFPLVPCLGNHELSLDLYNMFDIPDTTSYYAMRVAGNLLRVYTLNTDIGCPQTGPYFCDSTQRNWLENDLQQHTGNTNEPYWKFVQYHYPFAAHATYPVNHTMVNCWASLFQDYKVKLVAESHAHVIKFTWPVVTSSVPGDSGFIRNDTNGIVYIGEGSWGAPLRPLFTHYSPGQAWKWTRNQASMPGFQVVLVSKEKIEVRVVEVDSVDVNSVGQVGLNDPPGMLPANLALWSPSNGSVVTITYKTPSGLPELPAGKAAAIYPNPANNMVSVDFFDKNSSAIVQVYDAFGRSIQSRSVNTGNTINMDVSSFNAGVYFIHITMKKFSENYKLSIIR
ncbi:MAG: T9SS type A sorting domain-containing protein [Bacteroidetes bacterium]|nr:T9SS type A sorting domain-containing protein [Bacteroidota bacterium]